MNMVTVIVVVVCMVWILGTYLYYNNRRPKLQPLVIATGAVKSDDEVLIRAKPVVVNVVFAESGPLDTSLVADVVVNYRDLLTGKYNLNVTGGSVATGGGTETGIDPKEAPSEDDKEVEGGPELPPAPGVDEIPDDDKDDEAPTAVDVKTHNFNF